MNLFGLDQCREEIAAAERQLAARRLSLHGRRRRLLEAAGRQRRVALPVAVVVAGVAGYVLGAKDAVSRPIRTLIAAQVLRAAMSAVRIAS